MFGRDTGIGCGYPGKGDMRLVGSESPCNHGRIRRVALAEGRLLELTKVCPQCLGSWRRYRHSAASAT